MHLAKLNDGRLKCTIHCQGLGDEWNTKDIRVKQISESTKHFVKIQF